MRRAEKLRQIYVELRAAGVEAHASDLVRIAHVILQTYSGEIEGIEGIEDLGAPHETKSLVHVPVDNAMDDGGWRILDFEEKRSATIDDLEPDELLARRRRAFKILGGSWHYQPPQD